jgi:hypothetical protein
MKVNQPQKTEEQLKLNLENRKGTVSLSGSRKALEDIKEMIKRPKSDEGFNYYDEQK